MIPLFDAILLLKVDVATVRQRLDQRNKNFGQQEDVQNWIMSWKDWWENDMKEQGAVIVDGNRSVQEIADDIIKLFWNPGS